MSASIRLFALVLLALPLLLAACADRAEITGTATYRERMALPPEAVLEVVLEDITLADAPAREPGRVTLPGPGQPPFAFTMSYDPRAVDQARRYAVRARITVGDRLIFTTDTVHPVLTGGHGASVDLLLKRAANRPGAGAPAVADPDAPRPMAGLYTTMADAALFTDCATGRRLPVSMEADHVALERAYLEWAPEPGAELMATFTGRVQRRPAMEGDAEVDMVVVDAFEGVWPGETCGHTESTFELENMYWKLTRLEGRPVTVAAGAREPHLVLHPADGRVTGFGGCNRLTGGYQHDGDRLSFGRVAATMMACPDGMEQEHALLMALERVQTYRIDGRHLEMLDADGAVVLRFEERARQ